MRSFLCVALRQIASKASMIAYTEIENPHCRYGKDKKQIGRLEKIVRTECA